VHISNSVPMKLNLDDIQQALKIDQAMKEDTFNVVVQALHEDELQKFGSTKFLGWRHFLNQDFSVSMHTYAYCIGSRHPNLHATLTIISDVHNCC
jgi:hypothetical protein